MNLWLVGVTLPPIIFLILSFCYFDLLGNSSSMPSPPPDTSFLILPWASVAYLQSKNRQYPKWTYRQALTNTILKVGLHKYISLKRTPSVSLKPGLERKRFILIKPAGPELFSGIALDEKTKPEAVGATWYPKSPSPDFTLPEDQHVVLHLHGGSYISGDGRIGSCHFIAKNFLSYTPSRFVLCLQYRLAGTPNGRFPAQLQDAISAYSYLLDTLHVPASHIILSGDSAGANLALGLLRYITQFDNSSLLPAPKCTWLFSPWTNIPEARNSEAWKSSPNYKTEYVPASFPARGATLLLRDLEITKSVEENVAPIKHPFMLPSPMLVVTGGKEVLCQENLELAHVFKGLPHNESLVDIFVSESTPHDLFMIAWIMGFKKEARECAEKAGDFVKKFSSSFQS
jgi:acetyl esterase/lipase